MDIIENAFEFLEELFPKLIILIGENDIIGFLVYIPIVGLGIIIFRLLLKIFGYKKLSSGNVDIDD